MKIFLQTDDPGEVALAASWGVLDGVVLDPLVTAREGRPLADVITDVASAIEGPIFVTAPAGDADGLIRESRSIANVAEGVVAVLPPTVDGIRACSILAEDGIATDITLCFSPGQALLAAKAGASYVSPQVGRLDDVGHDGMQLVREVVQVFDAYELPTQVTVAATRHTKHVVEAALIGADAVAARLAVIEQLFHHPLSDTGLRELMAELRTPSDVQ